MAVPVQTTTFPPAVLPFTPSPYAQASWNALAQSPAWTFPPPTFWQAPPPPPPQPQVSPVIVIPSYDESYSEEDDEDSLLLRLVPYQWASSSEKYPKVEEKQKSSVEKTTPVPVERPPLRDVWEAPEVSELMAPSSSPAKASFLFISLFLIVSIHF